jgi:hypothetical protein
MIFKKTEPLCDEFVDKALSFIGYRARENRDNIFGERRNLNGQPWDGIFIDVVAEESGMPTGIDGAIPVLTYAPTAMSQFVKADRFFKRPAKGDIVFFETSTVSDFGVPHVGIVTDASRHAIDGSFECVEGMTSSGMPKRVEGSDGVHLRRRHVSEVIGFGRPNFAKTNGSPKVQVDGPRLPTVTLAHLRNGARPNKSVELLQIALAQVTGITGYDRAKFCKRTQLAYAKFRRSLGYPNSSASATDVDIKSLTVLAGRTKIFNVKS